MNATCRRLQRSVEMVPLVVPLVGLVDPNRVVEAKESRTARTKKDKVPISEIILRQHTADNINTFLSLT